MKSCRNLASAEVSRKDKRRGRGATTKTVAFSAISRISERALDKMWPDEEKCVFITGATRGIGKATAQYLHEKGFRVAATGRELGLIADLEKDGFAPIYCDVTDQESVSQAIEEARSKLGPIGAVVNNAGYGIPGPVDSLSSEDLKNLFEVNVFGAHRVATSAIGEMKQDKEGVIVNVSSAAGRIVTPNLGAYCASKFALEALSDAMRMELSPYGINVVLVEPGPIDTSFGERSRDELLRVKARLEEEDPQRARDISRYWEKSRGALDRFRKDAVSVAEVIYRAITAKKPKARYRITLPALAAELGRLLPAAIVDSAMARFSGANP